VKAKVDTSFYAVYNILISVNGKAMHFNVSQLLKESAGARRLYEFTGQSGPINEFNGPSPVNGTVEILRVPNSILVLGRLEIELVSECSRCLENYTHIEHLNLEEEYFPLWDVNTGATLEPPEDPAAFALDENHNLDLSEAVRQHAILSLPMQPVCRIDCAGLCSTCGVNLNKHSCDCPTSVPDERLAVLAQLKTTDK
jgi:uncharacterized protein